MRVTHEQHHNELFNDSCEVIGEYEWTLEQFYKKAKEPGHVINKAKDEIELDCGAGDGEWVDTWRITPSTEHIEAGQIKKKEVIIEEKHNVTNCEDCPFAHNHSGHGECWTECGHKSHGRDYYQNILWGCQEKFTETPKWCPLGLAE